MLRACITAFTILFSFSQSIQPHLTQIPIHSACNLLPDGLRYIKATSTAPIIPVICSNGYTMLTPALNLDTYLKYFKSLTLESTTQFAVAPQCQSCSSSNSVAIDTDNLWIASVHLDQSQCPCYKPLSSTIYTAFTDELPSVKSSKAASLSYGSHSEDMLFTTDDDEEEGVPSSCSGLRDGSNFIMPSEDIGEIIHVNCYDGWIILDPSLDTQTLPLYFTSWLEYTDKVSGPSFDDFATWRQWLYPANQNTEFTLSPDCSVCAAEPFEEDISPTNQVYHMTGNYYLCAWGTKGDCDMDLDGMCYSCVNRHGGNDYLEYMSGTCTHMVNHADQKVYTHHEDCTGMSDNSKPSLGLNGKYCVCYRNNIISNKRHTLFDYEVPVITLIEDDNDDAMIGSNTVHLCVDDFADGTYRIGQSGTYILDCDIEFEPNVPDNADSNANDYDSYGWFPLPEQEEEYPTGFLDNSYVGEYQLGFIAAVTIECDNVVFDLNGHTIEQSKVFYLQQRFFSVFLLNNKNFIEGQGPVFFGAEMKTVSNIIIKNGIIGRSSHHGILARQTTNLLVEDVSFNNFDVAGISLSGFEDVILRNLDIGPNNQDCAVTGRYLHARAMLPRYKQLVEEHGNDNIMVNGERKNVKDIIDRLIDSMNIIYNEEILGYEYDVNDELYSLSQLEFGNKNSEYRVSDGGVVYGILLNGYGGAVMGLGSAPRFASNVEMESINIHDFILNPIEKCKFALSNSPFTVRGPFADVFDADVASFVDDSGFLHYIGTPFSDAQLAFARATESWSALSHTDMGKRFQRWTSGELSLDYQSDVMWSCNTDIQLHVNKGPIGLRIDGITDAKLSNIYISSLLNIGDLGDTDKCGSYLKGNGHQDSQVQLGYTGTDNYGMIVINSGNVVLENDLKISNIDSHNGISTGFAILRDAVLTLSENAKIDISNIAAGSRLALNTLTFADLPNKIPIACPAQINLGSIQLMGDIDDFVVIDQDSIIGHAECLDTLHILQEEMTTIPSACNNLADGEQYILPYGLYQSEHYPLLPVICSAGDTILNPSLSFTRYSQYFSSFYLYDIGIGGPSLDDFSSWREWFLPFENRDIKAVFEYGIADDCESICEYGNPETDDIGTTSTNNAYYMTGNFYLCAWITKGDCDMDAETYQCYDCARHGGRSDLVFPGVCSHIKTSVDFTVHTDHYQCTGNNDNLKPSIGTNGAFCTCYKPQNNDLRVYQMNTLNFENDILLLKSEQELESNEPNTDITYLSSDDFLYGTYRIRSSGVYILTENILLNFNAPSDDIRLRDDFSPNSYDSLYWFPSQDGSQDEEYMGASTWSGPYQLGFFSGITIECDDVVLDLNGFEIAMHPEFYFQQRVFSIIELAAKNFVSGQGPVDFGPYLSSATNVVIKNGAIGLASHHGVHGNDASGINLEDLKVYNFDVAGIQLNGFEDVIIRNCEIGPSSSNIAVTGRYLHARVLLRRYNHLVDNYGDETFTFYLRETKTVREYVDELINEMDMVYNHVINQVQYDDDDEEWIKASDLFLNPNENGYGDGGVVYGILLNSRGGAVMGFGNAPSQSRNAIIDNVYIHDLAISPLEKLKFKTNELGGATRGPVADVFDIMKVSDQWDDIANAKYIGTAYSDVQIVMSAFEKSWYVLDHTCFDDGIMNWVMDGQTFDNTGYFGGCNTDIQLHINKGVIGLRIDNIIDFQVINTQITNLLNTGDLGTETEICGAYTQGNAHQDPLITPGYTGTEGYGITITQSVNGTISNVNINNIQTYKGNANGIALFKDSSVHFNTVIIDNVVAGSQLLMEELRPQQNYLPNKIPIACSIFNNNYNTQYTLSPQVIGTNINGFLVCNDDALIGDCEQDSCIAQYEQSYFDELSASSTISFNVNKHYFSSSSSSYLPKIIIILSIFTIVIAAYAYKCGLFNRYKSLDATSSINPYYATSESTPLLPN